MPRATLSRTFTASSPYTLTYSTGTRTNGALTAVAAATTAATNVTPYGFSTAAQADAVRAGVNACIVDIANIKQVLTQVVLDLQAAGLLG